MTVWFVASGALGLVLAACAVLILMRRDFMQQLVILQFGTMVAALLALTLAQGLERPNFFDLAALLALLGIPSTIAAGRIVERWLP